MSDITRSRKNLVAENAILRQQFIVLKRQVKRPKFTSVDRLRLILFSRLTQFLDSALHLVQPQTLLRGHRDLFRRNWKRKSGYFQFSSVIVQETG
jgi:putative transposase